MSKLTLMNFWEERCADLDRLGLSSDDRDELLKVGVNLQLEEMYQLQKSMGESLVEIAMALHLSPNSPGKLARELSYRFVEAAKKFELCPGQSQVLCALTLAVNNCCFGDFDEGFGRFENFSEIGHGIDGLLKVTPEDRPIGLILWWVFAEFTGFGPVVLEATKEGNLRCTIRGFSPIVVPPTSPIVRIKGLVAWQRLFDLAQAGRLGACIGSSFSPKPKIDPVFLNYPLTIRGRLSYWERFLDGLEQSPAADQFEFKSDWLENAGFDPNSIEELRTRELAIAD